MPPKARSSRRAAGSAQGPKGGSAAKVTPASAAGTAPVSMGKPPKPPAPPRVVPAARERRLVAVAEIARPHGIAGELRLKVYNPGSDLLRRRPPVLLRLPDGTERD